VRNTQCAFTIRYGMRDGGRFPGMPEERAAARAPARSLRAPQGPAARPRPGPDGGLADGA
jgi:hypothetical protein